MTPEEWQKVSEIFQVAIEMDGADRNAFLDSKCDGNEVLRREVESLLAASSEAGDFISQPAAGAFASDLLNERSLSPDEMLGHYRIVSKIGTGGMGEVFLAEDTKLGRKAAIKTLSSMFDGDENFLKRFRNEARAAASLNYPHVATVYSVEEHNGRPFIAMEYIDGQTLDSLIPETGLDIDTFARWFVPITQALAHAHARGIVHRDIKPGNVMVTNDGLVKILDFGLADFRQSASPAEADTGLTQPGQVLGTPSYMSPEQARGEEVDHRSDIFSLGVVMYEAVTGRKPFKGESNAEIVSNLLKTEPPGADMVRSSVPPAVSALIERCLRKRRRDRPADMEEVRRGLEEAVPSARTRPSFGSFSQRFYRQARSGSIWPKVAGAAAVVLVAGFGWFFFSRGTSGPPVNFANMTIRRLSQTNDLVFAAITPDGRSIIYNTVAEDGDRTLWIRRVDDRNALKLVDRQPVQYWGGLTANADSSHIFYITADRSATRGTMYRVSSLGGVPRRLADGVNDLGSLSADGKRIFYVRYKETMRIMSASSEDGGDERVIFETDPKNTVFRDPQLSADGRSIFFSRMDRIEGVEFWTLVRIPAEGGKETIIIPRQREKINEIAVLSDGTGLLINATDPASNRSQLFYVALSDSTVTRVTNDLNAYFGVSVDREGRSIVAAQRVDEKRLWVGEKDALDAAQPITPEATVFRQSDWTPDGRIVYDAVDNNRAHIFISDADGNNRQQLTPNDSGDSYPRVSGDGRYVVFTSNRNGYDQVWRMNIDGSNQTLLSAPDDVATGPRFAPDGQTVYFYWTRGDRSVLGRIPVTGGEITELERFSETEWALSPDGSRVAYSFWDSQAERYMLGIMRLDSPVPEAILDSAPIYLLKWKPDGNSVYVREREAGSNPFSTIVEHNIATKKSSIFLSTTPDYVIDIAFSRDGQKASIVRGRLLTDAVMLTTAK